MRFLVGLACAAGVAASTSAALAQVAAGSASAFDGTYAGVSAESRGGMSEGTMGRGSGRTCPVFNAPGMLTIAGGHAQVKWGDGSLQGDVTAQGALTMRGTAGGTFQGQIEAQGNLKGQYTGYCTYALSWQRRR